MVTNRSGAPDSTAKTANTVPDAPVVPTRCPASGPSGGRPRLVATRSSTAAAPARVRVRHGSVSVPEVASRPTASSATAIEAVTSCASRRTESVEVTRVAASTTAATATWPTAPVGGARLGDRADEQRERDGDDAHHGERRAGVRPAGPPPGDTEHAEERGDDPAPSLRDERCQGGGAEHHEHGEQLAAPATRQVQPTERDGAGQRQTDRGAHPAVATGHGDHVEVGRGGTGGDEGHRRGPDDATVGASVGLCTAHAQGHQQAGQQGARGDPRARPEPAVLGGQDEQHRHTGHRDERAGDRQHRGHRSLAAVPGHGGCGRRRQRGR